MKKRTRLASAISIALTASLMPFSMSVSANPQATEKIEVIEVTSIRESITSSLNTKRYSDSVVDSLSADDIGSFPDVNVAESLQRIPGVSITRVLGEGEQVSIRGFSPGQNLTLVNGQQLQSSGFELQGTTLGRATNFSLLPATMTQTIEVYKSSEAKLADGGVGGTINIITRKPLAQRDNTLALVNASYNYNSNTEEFDPDLSALYSWKNDGNNFGALISVDYQDKNIRRDAFEIIRYTPVNLTNANGNSAEGLLPEQAQGITFIQQRKRETIMAAIQYQPIASVDLNLSYLDSTMEGDNRSFGLVTDRNIYKSADILDFSAQDGVFTSVAYGDLSKIGRSTHRNRDAEISNRIYTFEGKWTGESSNLSFVVGGSDSSGGQGDRNTADIALPGRVTTNITNGIVSNDFGSLDLTNFSQLRLDNYSRRIDSTENENSYVSIDYKYAFGDAFVTSIEIGGRYLDAEQSSRRVVYNNRSRVSVADGEGNVLREAMRRNSNFNVGMFGDLSNITNDYVPTVYQYLNPDLVEAYDCANIGGSSDGMDELGPFNSQCGFFTGRSVDGGNTWKVEEETTSFYLQANFESEYNWGVLRGNTGVRYMQNDTTVFNFSNEATPTEKNQFAHDFVEKGDTDKLLPALNIVFELDNDWIVRGAASTVISRPQYTELARAVDIQNIDDDDQLNGRVSKGNAALEPFEANKYDISVEWYYDEGESISLGVFYYDVKTFVVNEETAQDLLGDGRIFIVNQPVNAEGGSVKGVEFAFTQDLDQWLEGLGFQLNYTRLEADSGQTAMVGGEERDLPLAGLSENTYNAIVYYSLGPWDARISYNYRDEFYLDQYQGLPRFNDEIKRLSMKVNYKFDNGLKVYVQGANLTNEKNFRYFNTPSMPYQIGETGTNLRVGLQYQF